MGCERRTCRPVKALTVTNETMAAAAPDALLTSLPEDQSLAGVRQTAPTASQAAIWRHKSEFTTRYRWLRGRLRLPTPPSRHGELRVCRSRQVVRSKHMSVIAQEDARRHPVIIQRTSSAETLIRCAQCDIIPSLPVLWRHVMRAISKRRTGINIGPRYIDLVRVRVQFA